MSKRSTTVELAPMRSPRVRVDPAEDGGYVAICRVPGCEGWSFRSVKTACQEEATRHRQAHKNAVPVTSVEKNLIGGAGFIATCGTHWRTDETVTSRADCEGELEYHLIKVHGLVKANLG